MNKNRVFILVFILIILSVVLYYYGGALHVSKFFPHKTVVYSNEIKNIKIKEIKPNSIVVEGVVDSQNLSKPIRESRTIEFMIENTTEFINKVTVFTKEEIKSGKVFYPEIKVENGNFKDLNPNSYISQIETDGNLLSSNKVTALKVYYVTTKKL